MVFSDADHHDDFAPVESSHSVDLLHDIEIINGIIGEFQVTDQYRESGQQLAPTR